MIRITASKKECNNHPGTEEPNYATGVQASSDLGHESVNIESLNSSSDEATSSDYVESSLGRRMIWLKFETDQYQYQYMQVICTMRIWKEMMNQILLPASREVGKVDAIPYFLTAHRSILIVYLQVA